MTLNSLSAEFKALLSEQSEVSNSMSAFLETVETSYSREISEKLKKLEEYIDVLQKAKNELFELYDKEIVRRTNEYFEKQSKILLQSMEMKKEIAYVNVSGFRLNPITGRSFPARKKSSSRRNWRTGMN